MFHDLVQDHVGIRIMHYLNMIGQYSSTFPRATVIAHMCSWLTAMLTTKLTMPTMCWSHQSAEWCPSRREDLRGVISYDKGPENVDPEENPWDWLVLLPCLRPRLRKVRFQRPPHQAAGELLLASIPPTTSTVMNIAHSIIATTSFRLEANRSLVSLELVLASETHMGPHDKP